MIKLELPPKPSQLTEELQEKLTQRFKDTGESVWNKEWLKEALLQGSFGKCCYSEVRLQEESKYMEVDHFRPKGKYPDLVIEWTNLRPSCKKCNGEKGKHDPNIDPIVDPYVDNPQDFFTSKHINTMVKTQQGRAKKQKKF